MKRSNRMRAMLSAVATAVAVTGYYAPTQALYYTNDLSFGVKTWGRTIPVCFNSSTVAQTDFAARKTTMMNAVARSWTQATGLRFTGWGECPQVGTPKMVNIGLNTFNKGCDAAATTPLEGRIDMNICPPAWNDETIIHEFGHALGFEHEMHRPDFNYEGCIYNKIPGGDVLDTIPDYSSIMVSTYCHRIPELSSWDISGAQNLWGRPNYFADVNGDGRADAIVVNPNGIFVRITDASGKMPASSQALWTPSPFWGWRGTYFADVDGDKRADAIAVDSRGVAVMRSTGTKFENMKFWDGPYWGEQGTYFADVSGDGRADAIVVNNDQRVFVAVSDGQKFVRDKYWLMKAPNDREHKNYFADVTGADSDGKRRADLIAINQTGLKVCPALIGGTFGACTNWTKTASWGERGTFFADFNGDGRDDAIVIRGPNGTYANVNVRYSDGVSFGSEGGQLSWPLGQRGLHFANVDSNPALEAIAIEEDGIWVSRATAGVGLYNATGGAYYGLR